MPMADEMLYVLEMEYYCYLQAYLSLRVFQLRLDPLPYAAAPQMTDIIFVSLHYVERTS